MSSKISSPTSGGWPASSTPRRSPPNTTDACSPSTEPSPSNCVRQRAFVPHSAPSNPNPIVRFIFEEMNRQQVTLDQMARRAKINKNTFKDMRTRTDPKLSMVEKCLHVLGHRLEAVTKDEAEYLDQQRRTYAIMHMTQSLPRHLPKSRALLVNK
jgi:hypothetical protein